MAALHHGKNYQKTNQKTEVQDGHLAKQLTASGREENIYSKKLGRGGKKK